MPKVNIELFNNLNFNLPEELIAKYPVEPPENCKLMYINKKNHKIDNLYFFDLQSILKEGDLIIANNTKVESRRIFLRRKQGGRIETVFLERMKDLNLWKVLIKKRKKLNNNEILVSEIDPKIEFIVHKKTTGELYIEEPFDLTETIFETLGQMPIPPYMKREEEKIDKKYYQNYFSKISGSSAAPTAALHFSDNLVQKLNKKNINIEFVTLHIGYGTFAPLKEENFTTKSLHKEYYHMSDKLAHILAQKNYNRLISLGTSSLRVLETIYQKTNGRYDNDLTGETTLFLYPPDKIKSVNGLITNFHLPASSLLLLTACFIKPELLRKCYDYAINQRYRFYSYGDAMIIL
ncbi:MAG: tRNA preQ1(34) S-adenosylmethionine ribosyltransferase-isomerase QueA [Spirochaetia bacterium]|nr:tRNA preQ1(34) S-adenosylmethionine ribosyltransferase-isomerase QueA [Spirochaetia bacterium]